MFFFNEASKQDAKKVREIKEGERYRVVHLNYWTLNQTAEISVLRLKINSARCRFPLLAGSTKLFLVGFM